MKTILQKLLELIGTYRKQAILFFVILMSVLLLMDYNARSNSLDQLSQKRDQVFTQQAELALTSQYLKTQIAFATSEAGPAYWAGESGHLGQQGDIHVVLIPPEEGLPTPTPLAIETQVALENWEIWLLLFMGQ